MRIKLYFIIAIWIVNTLIHSLLVDKYMLHKNIIDGLASIINVNSDVVLNKWLLTDSIAVKFDASWNKWMFTRSNIEPLIFHLVLKNPLRDHLH